MFWQKGRKLLFNLKIYQAWRAVKGPGRCKIMMKNTVKKEIEFITKLAH